MLSMAKVQVKVEFAAIITELQSLAQDKFLRGRVGPRAYAIRDQLSPFGIGMNAFLLPIFFRGSGSLDRVCASDKV